jgi:hypothetical protein
VTRCVEVGSVVCLIFAENLCRLSNLTTGLSLNGRVRTDTRQNRYLKIDDTSHRERGGFGA